MEPKAFAVYRSSAGSGKTFTLVKEYLRLALDDAQEPPSRFRSINAITFTNKAAAEMKQRVLQTLQKIISGDPGGEVYLDQIEKDLRVPKGILRHRAKGLLHAILHEYGDFSVGTIDSFTHRVIRTFAHDLRLSRQFEISTDPKELLSIAVDLMLDKTRKSDPLLRHLLRFQMRFISEEKNWDVRKALLGFAEKAYRLEERSTREVKSGNDDENLRRHLENRVAEFRERMKGISEKLLALFRSVGWDENSLFQGKRGVWNWLLQLQKKDGKGSTPGSYARQALWEDVWVKKSDPHLQRILESIRSSMDPLTHELRQAFENEYPRILTLDLVLDQWDLRAIFRAVKTQLDHYRRENQILLISDLNRLISGVIKEQPSPFIYERLGTRYRHYLIDEFQDTSTLQWLNLLPLLHQSLSEGHFNMLVGDGKQSIYRFRGGDVEQFVLLPEVPNPEKDPILEERRQALMAHYEPKVLRKNFRSAREIVSFNNDLFRYISGQCSGKNKIVFLDADQETTENAREGYVELRRTHSFDEHGAMLLEQLKKLYKNGRSWREIAVLTRNNREGGNAAMLLQQAGIPVISSDALLVNASPRVRFTTRLMGWIAGLNDKPGLALIREFLFTPQDNDQVRGSAWINAKKGFSKMGEPTNRNSTLPDLYEFILTQWDLRSEPDPSLVTFGDLVLKYSEDHGHDVASFLHWWEDRKDREFVVAPEGVNAVRVMTIHKAKGLEFPVVILPYCNWETQKHRDLCLADLKDHGIPGLEDAILPLNKRLEGSSLEHLLNEERERSKLDNLNLLYVATTRAVESLYIFFAGAAKEHDIAHGLESWLTSKGIAPDAETIRFGTEWLGTETHPSTVSEPSIQDCSGGKWQDRLKLRKSRHRRLSEEGFDPRNEGIVIHGILEELKNPASLTETLTRLTRKGILKEKEIKHYQNKLEDILSDPAIMGFFDGTQWAEKEFLLPDGSIIRPDRIRVNETGTDVIDFKTGDPKPDHETQVQHYAKTLAEAGFQNVKAWLIYTDEKRVKQVRF